MQRKRKSRSVEEQKYRIVWQESQGEGKIVQDEAQRKGGAGCAEALQTVGTQSM